MTTNPAADWQLIWLACEYLRDHDFSEQSEISRLLREKDLPGLRQLTAQSLREVAELVQNPHSTLSEYLTKIAAGFHYTFCLSVAANLTFFDIDPDRIYKLRLPSQNLILLRLQRTIQEVETNNFAPGTAHPFSFILLELSVVYTYVNLPLEKVGNYLLTGLKQQPYLQTFFATL